MTVPGFLFRAEFGLTFPAQSALAQRSTTLSAPVDPIVTFGRFVAGAGESERDFGVVVVYR